MPGSLAAQLEAARRRRFVGRENELDRFRAAISAEPLPFYVLHLYGPGGVGKTTLLREFGYIAGQRDVNAFYLDSRNIDPTPESLNNALRQAIGLDPQTSPAQWFAAQERRSVILVDTYELLVPLDDWLRDQFLPQMPANVLTVLAGRQSPAHVWRTDPGWRAFVYIIPLRNLDPEESVAYLNKYQVPADQHGTVVNFTHGHPLALSLIAEQFVQHPETRFEPEEAPDVIRLLLEQFVESVPSPAHRDALEACALVGLTTEPLLAAMLQTREAHNLFEWLRSLSFIDSGRHGLFPHDLAREALTTDLRWRNPNRYEELHNRARQYYMTQFEQSQNEQDQRRILFDYIYLHRDNPVVRPYFEWQEGGSVFTDKARPQDEETILSIVAAHEGEEARQLAGYWLEKQPHGVSIFRNAAGATKGLLLMVALEQTTAADRQKDPAVQAAWEYLAKSAPLRPGERATYFRFWMADDTYQDVSQVQSRIFLNMVQHYLTTPALAFTFLPCANPDFWLPIFTHVDLQRLKAADFRVGGQQYGLYGHDWRVTPPLAWLALMAERELSQAPQASPPPPPERLIVLSETDFKNAVRDALRYYTNDENLYHNPLMQSRLIVESAGAENESSKKVETLRTLLQTTAQHLQHSPRQRKFYRALHHTYIQPVGTQEQVAEYLDTPFSTYRRHLRSAIDQVARRLWQQELGNLG